MKSMNQISIANYFNKVQPQLTKREEWVLEAIEKLEPCTAEAVANYYKVGINIVSGRFTGLKNKGRIHKAYEGLNSHGNKVGYFVSTPPSDSISSERDCA